MKIVRKSLPSIPQIGLSSSASDFRIRRFFSPLPFGSEEPPLKPRPTQDPQADSAPCLSLACSF